MSAERVTLDGLAAHLSMQSAMFDRALELWAERMAPVYARMAHAMSLPDGERVNAIMAMMPNCKITPDDGIEWMELR